MTAVAPIPGVAPVSLLFTTDVSGTAPIAVDAAVPQGPVLGPALPEAASAAPERAATSTALIREAAFTTDLPDGRARIAIATAMAQIGLPYVWGGAGRPRATPGSTAPG